jgi:hypothetical protein
MVRYIFLGGDVDHLAMLIGSVKTRLWLAYLVGVSIEFNHGRFGMFQTLASKRRRRPWPAANALLALRLN